MKDYVNELMSISKAINEKSINIKAKLLEFLKNNNENIPQEVNTEIKDFVNSYKNAINNNINDEDIKNSLYSLLDAELLDLLISFTVKYLKRYFILGKLRKGNIEQSEKIVNFIFEREILYNEMVSIKDIECLGFKSKGEFEEFSSLFSSIINLVVENKLGPNKLKWFLDKEFDFNNETIELISKNIYRNYDKISFDLLGNKLDKILCIMEELDTEK